VSNTHPGVSDTRVGVSSTHPSVSDTRLARQMSCSAVRDIAAGEELKVDYFYPGPSVPSCLVVSLELSDAKVYEP